MKEYYSPPQLAEELGTSLRSVQRRLREMKPYIGTTVWSSGFGRRKRGTDHEEI